MTASLAHMAAPAGAEASPELVEVLGEIRGALEQLLSSSVSPWRSTREAAVYCRRSVNVIKGDAAAGRLRGHQSCEGGSWSFHVDDLDRYMRGETTPVVPMDGRRRRSGGAR